MRSDRVIGTVDFHTAGIGMRLLTSGLGRLPGGTIGGKRRGVPEDPGEPPTRPLPPPPRPPRAPPPPHDRARQPRGRPWPLLLYPRGYYVSCGEGTIGAATVAVETGLVPRTGAETSIVIDTEAGVVETVARSHGDRVREVTLRWTPSFVALPAQTVEVEGVGEVPV